ncbi:hypothetical protein [Capnocytophaga canimorsus]|uniref:hypothetical protein n=1 Tax=Capnocytophaga canimorsus TaxID=28188 RepID=UPI00385F8D16
MQVEEIYLKLAEAIFSNIEKENWKKAMLHLEVAGASVGFKGFLDENERFDAPGGYLLAKAVLDLHKITTEGGNNQWNKAIFTLFPDGNFDMQFIWDQAWHDEIVRLSKS